MRGIGLSGGRDRMSDQNVPHNTGNNQGDIDKKKNISTWIILSLSLFFAFAPFIYGFFYIHQYGVNVPVDDQWASLVPWTINYFEGDF